jgi:undecaprenyl-diphosphatase
LLAAGGLKTIEAIREPAGDPVDWAMIALGSMVAAVTAFVSVKWLLRFVQTHTFNGFGWYRIALGAAMLVFRR